MTRRSKLWFATAIVFNLINIGGAVYANYFNEAMHFATHMALLIPGLYAMWKFWPRHQPEDATPARITNQRIEYLQQSIDAVALEVERIGEAQRFSDKLRSQGSESTPPNPNQ
jgi:hypothetical protein